MSVVGDKKKTAESHKKIYVVDTSVFMNDPDVVEHLKDNIIVVPLWVVQELDNLKNREDWRGSTARIASRRLDEYHGSLTEGVATKSGGTLYISYDSSGQDLPAGLELTNDKRIVLVAKKWQEQNPGNKLVLISNDTNLRLIARACGVNAEDYGAKGARLADLYKGTATIYLRDSQLHIFDNLREPGSISESDALFLPEDNLDSFLPNQCCTFMDSQGNSAYAIYKKEKRQFLALPAAPRKYGVVPKNPEQEFAFALLMDPNILLVTLVGRAGTGKTLMALLAANFTVNEAYKQLVVYRPNIELGQSLGFLPGSLEEKFEPWMKPILDNLELILKTSKTKDDFRGSSGRSKEKPHVQISDRIDQGLLEISPISFLRGRSIHQRFVIVDEAQNLNFHQAKTIITRIGNGTKIVLTGDLEQIDDKFLSATSSGLFHVVQHFKGQEVYGHITMQKSERSKLAELAAELL